MASNRMSGNLLGLEINGEFVPCEISCEFNFEADLRPASPIVSGRWKEWIAGVRTWSINLNAAMLLRMLDGASLPVILNAFMTGELMGIRFMVTNPAFPNFILSGNVIVQNGSISSTVNTKAGWNTVLMGNGPFEAEINTNLVYILATDDVGDELLEDGDDNLIIADPGTGQDIALTWEINYGSNPIVNTILIFYKNGVEIERMAYQGSGTLLTTYKEGDTFSVQQSAYPTFRWAPGSSAQLIVKVDGVTKYNATVTDQSPVDLQNYSNYVIPIGVSVIEVSSIGANSSLNYFTKNLQTDNNLAPGEYRLDISDNVEAGLGIVWLYPEPITISNYGFIVKGSTGTLSVKLYNLKNTDITYTLVGEGGYYQTGTIPALSDVTHSDVVKGAIIVTTSDI